MRAKQLIKELERHPEYEVNVIVDETNARKTKKIWRISNYIHNNRHAFFIHLDNR